MNTRKKIYTTRRIILCIWHTFWSQANTHLQSCLAESTTSLSVINTIMTMLFCSVFCLLLLLDKLRHTGLLSVAPVGRTRQQRETALLTGTHRTNPIFNSQLHCPSDSTTVILSSVLWHLTCSLQLGHEHPHRHSVERAAHKPTDTHWPGLPTALKLQRSCCGVRSPGPAATGTAWLGEGSERAPADQPAAATEILGHMFSLEQVS